MSAPSIAVATPSLSEVLRASMSALDKSSVESWSYIACEYGPIKSMFDTSGIYCSIKELSVSSLFASSSALCNASEYEVFTLSKYSP